MVLKKSKGILVSRPGTRSSLYSWGVIPDHTTVDIAEAELPIPYSELFMTNTRGATIYLKNIYLVEFYQVDQPSISGGFISFATDIEIKDKIPLSELEAKIKELDPDTRIVEYKDPPTKINEEYIAELHKLSRTGYKLIKRFYATPIIFTITKNDEAHRIMMSFKEAFNFVQENPGILKGLLILPKYFLIMLLTSTPIPYEVLVDEIIPNSAISAKAFDNLVRALNIGALKSSMEEED